MIPSTTQHTAYLLFDLASARYAFPVHRVFEILWLPELTPVAQAPFDVPGIFNLRGQIVTVIDLNLRLGYRTQGYTTDNRVIVLADDKNLVGVIVDAVQEVRNLDPGEISPPPDYGLEKGRASLYISYVARLGDVLITILDEEHLLHYSSGLHEMICEANAAVEERGALEKIPARDLPVFCPGASPQERELFRQRAQQLNQTTESRDTSELLHLAVFALGSELFAIELDAVLEFTDVRNPTPVSCTPEHIAGCMNLRGEILTLVDIRGALNLGLSPRTRGSKVVVARIRDILVGVVVDDILDIRPVPVEDLVEIPSAVRASSREFLRGAVRFDERVAPLLDLVGMITNGDFVADISSEVGMDEETQARL